jgi:hypothetical protein
MKKLKKWAPVVLIALAMASCDLNSIDTNEYTEYEPVFYVREDMNASVVFHAPKPIMETGKIYIYQDYLFVNVPGKGIHIINNEDPTNPIPEGYLQIPGNFDLAIKDGYLFADNATDLISLRLPINGSSFNLEKRVENVFDEPAPPDGLAVPKRTLENRPKNSVIIAWQKKS